MACFLHPIWSFLIRKWDKLLLALCWILGLFLGGAAYRFGGGNLDSLLAQALISRPSIFGLLVSALLPLLFSSVAILLRCPGILYVFCLLKAFLVAYLACGVFSAYKESGWLIARLYLFTDLCASAVVYLFWHRHISGVRGFSPIRIVPYWTVLCAVWGFDFYYIAPLLRRCIL